MKKSVLVTGGAGFIGSHICKMYLSEGYQTICVDNLVSGSEANIVELRNDPAFHFYRVDIGDVEEMEELFKQFRPQIVNHHAAQKSVPYSLENPMYDLDTNLGGLLQVLSLVQKYPIETLLFSSSGGALSKKLEGIEKSTEEDVPQLISPYALTKFAGEQYIKMYSEEYNFNFTVLRYANVFGPKQVPDGESGVIPIFLKNLEEGNVSTLMTYQDMPRGCTRDYVYVEDVVEANRLATNTPLNKVVNIGSGTATAILDIYEQVLKAFSKSEPIHIVGPRPGDIKRSVLDTTIAKKELGWIPKFTLQQGLSELYIYYKTQHIKK
ncbi:SDR family NAD(P)-dependent oxidoreductase [Listeria rocourtiae]|uniref:SDR family NAD(P)-dependent oxidoreductase n=1 Tax=Listeria rocourtiae TaxID=647910 RepID=UPI0016255C11|nr:SDR family NAD(P)-dependent oxidoreductase [Listeria rocourtiae]MBC1605354.1 SDR family NAD(P)-dependent oxidoreductase [Listeria rocourtiae]